MGVPFAFAVAVVIWTTTPIGIAISNESLSYSAGASLRMVIALALSVCILIKLKQGLEWRKAGASYLAGSIGIFVGLLSTYWASRYIPSGLVSIMFGLSPIASALIASVLLKEPVSTLQRIGLGLSMIGLVLVFGEQLSISSDGYKGVIAMIVAATCFPLSSILVKRINAPVGPMQQTAGTLLVSSIGFLLVWLVVDREAPEAVSIRSMVAIGYLATFASVLGFANYFYLVPRVTASQLAIIPIITPVLGVAVGAVFNNEALGASSILGMVFIVVAVIFAEMGRRHAKQQLRIEPTV